MDSERKVTEEEMRGLGKIGSNQLEEAVLVAGFDAAEDAEETWQPLSERLWQFGWYRVLRPALFVILGITGATMLTLMIGVPLGFIKVTPESSLTGWLAGSKKPPGATIPYTPAPSSSFPDAESTSENVVVQDSPENEQDEDPSGELVVDSEDAVAALDEADETPPLEVVIARSAQRRQEEEASRLKANTDFVTPESSKSREDSQLERDLFGGSESKDDLSLEDFGAEGMGPEFEFRPDASLEPLKLDREFESIMLLISIEASERALEQLAVIRARCRDQQEFLRVDLARCCVLMQSDDKAKVKAAVDSLLQSFDPNSGEWRTHFAAWLLRSESEDRERVIQFLEEHATDGDLDASRSLQAWVYARDRRPQLAIPIFNSNPPSSPEDRLFLALAYLYDGLYAEAVKQLNAIGTSFNRASPTYQETLEQHSIRQCQNALRTTLDNLVAKIPQQLKSSSAP